MIGDNRAVEPLIGALKDENWNVQKTAAEALGKIGNKRALGPLMEALKDEDVYVRKTAGNVLEEMQSL
jgi:HEAT repeat protein